MQLVEPQSINFKVVPPYPTFSNWPEPKLIGLAGPARSGKDTVAGLLKQAFPVKTVAFADPIRAMLAAGFGFNEQHFNGPLKEVKVEWIGKSYRQMAQTLGTEWGRNCVNENLWVLAAYERVKQFHAEGYHAVITDVRFENEAAFVRNNGGVVWHIRRDGIQKVAEHSSEAGLTVYPQDVLISNNGTLEDLLDEVCDKF